MQINSIYFIYLKIYGNTVKTPIDYFLCYCAIYEIKPLQ
jgi:hypothetical protein